MEAARPAPSPGNGGPTISVVVPAYNEERYIAEALDAVLAQTRSPLEVIVVDDGSTDGTREVVAGYGGTVRLIQQENRGCPGAFDTGFREAKGEFVALCPADDVWEPQKLEWQQDVLNTHGQVDVVFGAASRFGLATGDHVRPERTGVLERAWFAAQMYRRNLIADPSAVVRRSLYLELGGYEPLVGEDYEFWMRALAADATFHYDPRLVVRLREHGGNLSYRAPDIWETNHLIHTRYADLAGDPELVRRTLAHDLLMIGYCRAALGRSGDARRSFRASLDTEVVLEAYKEWGANREQIETRLAFRTRLLDCFWAGLPVVSTAGDELGERIDRDGLGMTLPEGDADAVASGLAAVLERGKEAYSEGLRLAAERYAWSTVSEPLVRFVTSRSEPTRLGSERQGGRFSALRSELYSVARRFLNAVGLGNWPRA